MIPNRIKQGESFQFVCTLFKNQELLCYPFFDPCRHEFQGFNMVTAVFNGIHQLMVSQPPSMMWRDELRRDYVSDGRSRHNIYRYIPAEKNQYMTVRETSEILHKCWIEEGALLSVIRSKKNVLLAKKDEARAAKWEDYESGLLTFIENNNKIGGVIRYSEAPGSHYEEYVWRDRSTA